MRVLFSFSVAALWVAAASLADDVRPVQVQLREQEPGVFLVQWQVPKLIPVQATPSPVLPDGCETVGEHTAQDQEASWIHRQLYRCPSSLAGESLGIRYPFFNASLSTVVRVSLLSGEEHARILAPGEDSWLLPEGEPDVLRIAQQSLLFGVDHVLEEGAHFVLVLAFCLLGSTRFVARFAMGQLAAVPIALVGIRLEPALAEIGVVIAAVLLAREALRVPDARAHLGSLALLAGLSHGLGLASVTSGAVALLLALLGVDMSFVILGAAMMTVLSRVSSSWLLVSSYAAGSLAVAFGLGLFLAQPAEDVRVSSAARLPGLAAAVGGPGSQRIAPQMPDAAIQSFVAIEAFETRHEVLVRLRDVVQGLGQHVEIKSQSEIKEQLARSILEATAVRIDGEEKTPILDRVDFVTVDAQGVLPRPAPVRESVDDAFVGVTLAYVTSRTPRELSLEWKSFLQGSIPTTFIDPETTRAVELTAESPSAEWRNRLSEEPIPTVSAVSVEPRRVAVPLLSVPLVIAAAVLAWRPRAYALARIVLALAVLVGPLGSVAVAIPSSSVPSSTSARHILAGILPNVYRAFEFREESAAYDRLAVSVTGDTLTEVYLEHRRALEMEERGGARARVEAVEVQEVENVAPGDQQGFRALASWTVGGTVTHFGHRHFRENRYRASVEVVPVDDVWKIRSIDLVEEERVR